MKPRGFVGSSLESLEIARAIRDELDRDAEILVWDQGIFEPSQDALQSLLQTVSYCTFAIFVLSPDDLAKIRDHEHRVVRDNVIFELGLFFGARGREGTFMIVPRNEQLHLPTDLLGLTLLDYDSSKSNPRAALGLACSTIRSAVKKYLPSHGPVSFSLLASPSDLTQYGLAEVLGEVRIVKNSIPANLPQQTQLGTLTILFEGAPIANCFLGPKPLDRFSGKISDDRGIVIAFDSDYLVGGKGMGITASTINTSLGGQVSIHIPEGILLRDDGTSIAVSGVRADCSARCVGSTILAHVAGHPIKVASFMSTNPVTVAQVSPSLRLDVTTGTVEGAQEIKKPIIHVTEGFPEAFVQYANPTGSLGTANGTTNCTQLRFQLSMPIAGLGLAWPTRVESVSGVSSLILVGSSSSVAVYEFRRSYQRRKDTSLEAFDIMPNITVTSEAKPGDVFIQVQMWPDATSTSVPRYSHPLKNDPADILIRIRK